MLRFEVLRAMTSVVTVFWDVIQCNVVVMHQSFLGSHCLYLQGTAVTPVMETAGSSTTLVG
jgi:hypothetical protein